MDTTQIPDEVASPELKKAKNDNLLIVVEIISFLALVGSVSLSMAASSPNADGDFGAALLSLPVLLASSAISLAALLIAASKLSRKRLSLAEGIGALIVLFMWIYTVASQLSHS